MDENVSNSGDAWNWSVDEVVHNMCKSNHLWSEIPNYSLSNPSDLETLLRMNCVSGSTLLSLTLEELRVDLALQILGDRHAIYYAITKLRASSRGYQSFLSANSDISIPFPTLGNPAPVSSLSQTCPRPEQPITARDDRAQTSPSGVIESNSHHKDNKLRRRAILHQIESSSGPAIGRHGNIQAPENSEWDFLLEKYPPGGENDEALPLYGESESGGYGSSTQAEIDAEIQENRRQTAKKAKVLPRALVDSLVNESVERMSQESRHVQPSQHGPEAQNMWDKEHRNQSSINDFTGWIKRLKRRLESLQREIRNASWPKEKELLAKCESMRETISDLLLFEWKLKVCQMTTRPSNVPLASYPETGLCYSPAEGTGSFGPILPARKHLSLPSKQLKDLPAASQERLAQPRVTSDFFSTQVNAATKQDVLNLASSSAQQLDTRESVVSKLVKETCLEFLRDAIYDMVGSMDTPTLGSKVYYTVKDLPLSFRAKQQPTTSKTISREDLSMAKLWMCWVGENQKYWQFYRFPSDIIAAACNLEQFAEFHKFLLKLRNETRDFEMLR